jgi:hypothetical protein
MSIQKQTAAPATISPVKQFVNENHWAHVSGMSVAFWQKDRWLHKGHPPGCPFVKIGRSVRYELNQSLAWLENSRRSDSPQVA